MSKAEAIIKANLDGKFFYVDQTTGRTITKSVSFDYMPQHNPMFGGDFSSLSKTLSAVLANPWRAEEDDAMIEMRARGMKWEAIRKKMGRGEKAIKERYLMLCRERGIEPLFTSSQVSPALTIEAKKQIVTLRMQGVSVSDVAEMTGRPAYQVLDYYNRYLAAKGLEAVR